MPFKNLNIPTPEVKYSIAKSENGFDIEVTSDKLAKNVYLQIGDENGFFSDNYFDLIPGEKVSINLKTKISVENLDEILTVRTLDGAF